jgi:hypothetical protein
MNARDTPTRLKLATTLAVAAFLLGNSGVLPAQPSHVTMLDFQTGSEFEDYLRVLQVAGIAPLYPWSIRGFSPGEVSALVAGDTTGPWRLNERFSTARLEAGQATLTTTYNSAYPYGANDGPIWAGRGLTLAASGGVSGRYGPLSFTFAPVAFWASNAAFPLLSNGKTGNQAYNHGTYSDVVDLPQRFGPGSYSRVDPGSTGIRLDSKYASAGVSTANQWIGPATEYPFLLSTNAPGFPHLFVGTGEPVNIWVARIHARAMWGRLYQSEYGPVTGGTHFTATQTGTERLTTAATLVLLPRGVPGLELGASRYFHVPNREGGPGAGFWTKPFKVLLLKNEIAEGDTAGLDNQLVSVFFRWAFPASGFEVYGERGYEDQFYDMREFIQDIDHEREYMLGFQKTIRSRADNIDVVKGELVNYQLPTLARLRVENAVYLHSPLRQGHTNRGQLLGTSAGVAAAAASTLSWTRYSPAGRTGVTLRRIVRDQTGHYLDAITRYGNYNPLPSTTFIPAEKGTDVIVAIGLERMRFTKYLDFGARIEAMENYNRNFSDNVANLNLQIMARVRRW